MARAGLDGADCPCHDLTVRNREAPLRVVMVDDARRLGNRLPAVERIERSPT